jgi:arylsulfatase A-like enzyme
VNLSKKILFVAPLLLLLFSLFFLVSRRTPQNVLLITIDTLRADHLGCYGYSRKITPSLDELASQGIVFENAFAVMPTTVPSHGSILFGTWPRIHGSTSNLYRFSNKSLSFLPKVLQSGGYSTAAFISIDHLFHAVRAVPGFETIEGAAPGETRSAETTLSLALQWLKAKKRQRFFLWTHLWEPHQPYDLHPEFMNKIHPGFKNDVAQRYSFQAKGAYTKEGIQKMIDLYDNEIAYVDHQVGRFFQELKRTSVLDNTIVIVTADHGESLDEILETEGYGFDHGEFLYDSQLHVPLIVILPHSSRTGMRISQIVTLLDIMPTILDMSGLRIPSSVHGISLLPFLQNRRPSHTDQLVFLHRGKYLNRESHPLLGEEEFGVRNGQYKLIITAETHQSFLYRNFHEGTPILKNPIERELQKSLQTWLQMTDRFKSRHSIAVSDDEAERLRSLGYVQ